MTVVALFIAAALGIVVFPMLIPYLFTIYMVLNGIASRSIMNDLKASVGGTNIFFPDLLYAASFALAVYGVLRLLTTGRLRLYAPLTKAVVFLVLAYFMFFFVKVANGYFEGVPADTLVRRLALDAQCIYLFVPLFYLKEERTLIKLLYFIVILSLLFPLAQPFLYGSADQIALETGQGGTLRLGSGNANLLLMMGVLAFFVWEKKLWLSAVPLAGIAMLGQRSAFIAIILCIVVLSFQKKRSMKYMALLGVVGLSLVAALIVVQTTSTVPIIDKTVERFSQIFEETKTTKSRLVVIPIALEEFGKRPWVGYSYRDEYELGKIEHVDAFSFNMLHPHNFVLASLLRGGMLGTILLFGIIIMVLMVALRLSRQRDTKEQGMYLFAAILFFVVFSVMNTSFTSAGYVFWLLSGTGLWCLNQVHYNKSQQRPDQSGENDRSRLSVNVIESLP